MGGGTRVGRRPLAKFADVVIIDRDLTKIPPQTIRDAKIQYTIVGGRVVYDRNAPVR
jgi:predicted amidohydrolase YtcJ